MCLVLWGVGIVFSTLGDSGGGGACLRTVASCSILSYQLCTYLVFSHSLECLYIFGILSHICYA